MRKSRVVCDATSNRSMQDKTVMVNIEKYFSPAAILESTSKYSPIPRNIP
jgi:hypothetical protein